MTRIVFAYLFLLITVSGYSQQVTIEVLSVFDKKPVYPFGITVDQKLLLVTDSNGYARISTAKKKLRLSFPYAFNQLMDTTITIKVPKMNVLVYTANTFDSLQAEYDIANNAARLFCSIGLLVPVLSQEERKLEKEFGFNYYIIGCSPPAPVEKLRSYNNVVISHFKKKYGDRWLKARIRRL